MTQETDYSLDFNDLFEFYHEWPGLRATMLTLSESRRLEEPERKILASMIAIVDRVGPTDLRE